MTSWGALFGIGMFLVFLAALAVAGAVIWAALWLADTITGRPPRPDGPPPLPPGWDEPPPCPYTGRPGYDHPAYDRCPCGSRHVVNTATRRRVEPGVESV